jgi:hypothetical protein
MTVDRDPNDLARNQEEWRRRQTLDNELQADPELAEGPASSGRIALFGIAVLAILGVVLYGLNSSPTDTASNPPAQTTASGTTAPGKMSPTINPNANPGQTTGSAPAPAPQTAPPAANPSPGSAASGSNAPAGAASGQ